MARIEYTPAPPAIEYLKERFEFPLSQWGTGGSPHLHDPRARSGLSRVDEVLALATEARRALGKRDRKPGCRAYLDGLIASITKAREAFASVGENCDGPAALALCARIEASRAGLARAEAALRHTTTDRDKIRELRIDHDVELARGAELDRDIAALIDAVQFPALPHVAVFEQAKSETQAIAQLVRAGREACALHVALDQGAALTRARENGMDRRGLSQLELVSRLWIAYEREPLDAYVWRTKRQLESEEPTEAPAPPKPIAFRQKLVAAGVVKDANTTSVVAWERFVAFADSAGWEKALSHVYEREEHITGGVAIDQEFARFLKAWNESSATAA